MNVHRTRYTVVQQIQPQSHYSGENTLSKHQTGYLASGRIIVRQEVPLWWEKAALRDGLDSTKWRRDLITVQDVRDLIAFEPKQLKLYNEFGQEVVGWRQVTRADDTAQTFIVAPASYTPHPYGKWISDVCDPIIAAGGSEGLVISSAGILGEGAMAWTSISLPEAVKTRAGLDISPSLFLGSSLDQTLKTSARNVTIIGICDNTATAADRAGTLISEVKHTTGSAVKWTGHASAVAQFLGYAEKAKHFIDGLADIPMTDNDFERFLQAFLKDASDASDQAKTMNRNKRDAIRELSRNDVRCAPWANTALGAFQAANTWAEHYKVSNTRKNTPAAEGGREMRNMKARITGVNDDAAIIAALEASITRTPTSILV